MPRPYRVMFHLIFTIPIMILSSIIFYFLGIRGARSFFVLAATVYAALGSSLQGSPKHLSVRSIPELDSLKSLASSMIKSSHLPSGAFCESHTLSPANNCSGMNSFTLRALIKPDGSVSRHRYRAWNEDGNAVLGEFRGSISVTKWRDLLDTIASMRWVDEFGMPDPSIPPLPTEDIKVLTLCDGKRTASFSVSSPTPMAIGMVLNVPDNLADSAVDTAWAIRLDSPRLFIQGSELRFTAKWKVWGQTPISIEWPNASDQHGCGLAILEWSGDDENSSGLHAEPALRKNGKSYAWKATSRRPTPFEIGFPYKQPERGQKTGKLREFGILVKPGNSSQSIPLTLFSNRIRF